MRHIFPMLTGALLAGLLTKSVLAVSHPMTVGEYMSLRGPEPEAQIAYGPAPQQFVQLFEPTGDGPFPVVVLVHGGCFLSKYEGIRQMGDIAGALAADGIAVWNVEYRRADEPGGGYPGTFQDIGAALRLLEKKASDYRLDLMFDGGVELQRVRTCGTLAAHFCASNGAIIHPAHREILCALLSHWTMTCSPRR